MILSLPIYQALTTKSIVSLEVKDLDLDQATIHIKAKTTLNARTLELHSKQIMPMSRYLNEERPILNKTNSDKLILTRRYQPERGCGIHDVVKAYSNFTRQRHLPR